MVEPPALPYRDDVVVENGAAAPKSRLPSLEMRSPTAASGLLPTGEVSITTRTTFNQPPLQLYTAEETNSKKTLTPYVSYDSSCFRKNGPFLLPPAGGSSRQNQEKIGCSIQAVLKAVSAPARFWDRGARCFMGRFMLGLEEAAACFGRSMTRDSKTFNGME